MSLVDPKVLDAFISVYIRLREIKWSSTQEKAKSYIQDTPAERRKMCTGLQTTISTTADSADPEEKWLEFACHLSDLAYAIKEKTPHSKFFAYLEAMINYIIDQIKSNPRNVQQDGFYTQFVKQKFIAYKKSEELIMEVRSKGLNPDQLILDRTKLLWQLSHLQCEEAIWKATDYGLFAKVLDFPSATDTKLNQNIPIKLQAQAYLHFYNTVLQTKTRIDFATFVKKAQAEQEIPLYVDVPSNISDLTNSAIGLLSGGIQRGFTLLNSWTSTPSAPQALPALSEIPQIKSSTKLTK